MWYYFYMGGSASCCGPLMVTSELSGLVVNVETNHHTLPRIQSCRGSSSLYVWLQLGLKRAESG